MKKITELKLGDFYKFDSDNYRFEHIKYRIDLHLNIFTRCWVWQIKIEKNYTYISSEKAFKTSIGALKNLQSFFKHLEGLI